MGNNAFGNKLFDLGLSVGFPRVNMVNESTQAESTGIN
jgi:hypothetical protein